VAILLLASVGGGSQVNEQATLRVDDKRMHWVVASQRHTGQYRLRLAGRRDLARRARIADDLVVQFSIERTIEERDAGASGRAGRLVRAKALDDVRLPAAGRVLQGEQKTARRWGIVVIVTAAPAVGIDDVVTADRKVTDVSEIVGKDCSAESGREGNAGILILAFCGGGAVRGSRCSYDQPQDG
jgi:hypothetical protein